MRSEKFTTTVRISTLKIAHRVKDSHITSALSICDILSVIYCDILKTYSKAPKSRARDRFILSEGNAARVALHATLLELGGINEKNLLIMVKS